jgi:acetyltransferase-like isoleucine patch superfamily enzyme
MLTIKSFFDLSTFSHKELFNPEDVVWQPLNQLKEYMHNYSYLQYDHVDLRDGVPLTEHIIIHEGKPLSFNDLQITFGDTTKGGLQVSRSGMVLEGASVIMAGAVLTGNQISLGKGVLVESGAMIKSPTIIENNCEVRQGAYIRGYCLAGDRCVLGHTTEIKHSILLNDAKAGHFAYLGDSILGNNTNLGAGTKLANLKFLPGNVTIIYDGEKIDTSLRKFGAILGDDAQTGCNSVTSPGTLMGKNSMLLPNITAKRGFHQPRAIIRR